MTEIDLPECKHHTAAARMNFQIPRRSRVPALLFLLSVPALFAGIGSYALIGPDEPRYAAVARGMIERGDFVTPMLGGHPWFEKPALLYWLIGASYKLLGVSEWSTRISSALAGLAAVLIVYFIGRRARSEATGFLAAGILLTSLLFFSFCRGATFDILLTTCVTAALGLFLSAEIETGRNSRTKFLLCCASVGLAVLSKGLIGIALIGGIIAAYAALSGRIKKLFAYPVITGFVVFLVVCSVWYWPVIAINGRTFLREFFLEHHIERFTTNRYHHPGPVWYYLAVAAGGIFPWTPFLAAPLSRIKELSQVQWRAGNVSPKTLFVCWTLFPLLFLSLSVSKLPGYFLPALPGIALLIASETTELYESGRTALIKTCAWLSLGLLLGLAAWGAAEKSAGLSAASRSLLCASVLGVTIAGGVSLWRQRWKSLAISLIAGMSVVIGIAAYAAAPWMTRTLSFRDLASEVVRKMEPGEPIVYFGDAPREIHTLSFYADHDLFYDEQRGGAGRKDLREVLSSRHPSALVLVREANVELLIRSRRFQTEELGREREMMLFRVRLANDEGIR